MSSVGFLEGIESLRQLDTTQAQVVEHLEAVFGRITPCEFSLLVDTPEEKTRRVYEQRICGLVIKIATFCRENRAEFSTLEPVSVDGLVSRLQSLSDRFHDELMRSDFKIGDLFSSILDALGSGA